MRLVVTEKPSVAKSISAVLGANTRQDGYLEGGGFLISWCFGHLAELASADTYNAAYGKWNLEQLPIIPEDWKYSVGNDKEKQFNLLSSLMHRAEVTEVINACDAGREGELIFRTVYELAGCNKPMKRLWISSMEDAAIREGFAQLEDGREYDNLYSAALCRSKADWLVGINATRLFSVLYHRTLNVGRVVSPTLSLLVQRENEINTFQSEPFYTVKLDTGNFTAVSEKYKNREDAEGLRNACDGGTAVVRSVEQKKKTEKAPALYDLTTLQRDANRLLGYTAKQTLDYLQTLYEKKLCTYPRTDSRYLTDDMEANVSGIAAISADICGKSLGTVLASQVCNSKKVSDHHAVVPTESAAKQNLSSLPEGEREILKLVARQVMIAVSEAHSFMETVVSIDCGGQNFTAKGKTVLETGWKAFRDSEQKEAVLPNVSEGQTFDGISASIEEGKTKPPAHYTEDTLLAAMEHAGAKDMPEDAERKGIGTPATRAGILEKLVTGGFVERQKNKKVVNLIPMELGKALIQVLPEQLQSPLLTAEWEHRLKEIERGNLRSDQFMIDIDHMVSDLVENYEVPDEAKKLFPSERPVIGACPRCGSDVTESKTGFFCENRDCRFALWKDNHFLSSMGATMTKRIAAALLKDGRAHMTGLCSKKKGTKFDADLLLEDDGEKVSFHLEFNSKKPSKKG